MVSVSAMAANPVAAREGASLFVEKGLGGNDKVPLFSAMARAIAFVVFPGFQIIVTEHANLRDDWFQAALVEAPWSKPPALVPDDWPATL